MRSAINFWNFKDPQKSPHIQVKHQFVSHPKYRIFVRNGVEPLLLEKLKGNDFIYTPYLGVAYAIADISFVGCGEDSPVRSGEEISINTVLPLYDDIDLDIAKSSRVLKEVVPFKLGEDRALLESKTVLYSDVGDSNNGIVLRDRGAADVTRSMDEIVAWFPEW
jgi:CRISPR-associated protein Cas5h